MKVITRSLVVIFVALVAVPALAVTQTITTAVHLLATTTVLMMGGTGMPLAPTTPVENETYMATMLNGFFVQPGYTRTAVHTPEEFWPTTGTDHRTFDVSVADGIPEIDAAIKAQNYSDPTDKVIVFGYSQSATIIAFERQNLANDPLAPKPDQLEFVVVGSLNNPDGGLFTRLPGFVIPGLGVTFEPAMPDDGYKSTSYVREYEGLADLPDNPLNFLALGNALVGAAVLHPDYRSVDPDDPDDPNDSYDPYTKLPSTDPDDIYILVHTERLPILMILDGVVPEPILAGLDPVLRWGVDLGYDRTTPANVPTPFTLLPTFNPIAAAADLPGAIADGMGAAANAAAVPVAVPLQSKNPTPARVEQTNSEVIEKEPSPDDTKPGPIRQLLRGPLKFDPPARRNLLRPNGDGPLKRMVDALTGQRPERAADAETNNEQPDQPQ